MRVFRYKADILPITLIGGYFLCDILAYLFLDNILLLLLYVGFSIAAKGFICAWNHHHQHVQTFTLRPLNRLLEIIYGFHTGIVGYAWVLHHNLGHHMNYLDQSRDESAWKSPEGKRYSPLHYTWIIASTAYYRAWKVGKKYPLIQKKFLAMCILQFILLVGLIAYNPLSGVLIFLVPMVTGLFLTAYATYHHHGGLENTDHHESSYNIIEPVYNFLTGNLGYHTAHHIKGSLHWSLLPEAHKSIEHKIPMEYYTSYKLFPSTTRASS